MQHPRYAALVLRQTLALLVDAHPLDEALVIVEKARYQHLCVGYIGSVAPFFFFHDEVVYTTQFTNLEPCYQRFCSTAVWQKWWFRSPHTHLWFEKVQFSASTFVVKIALFAQPQNASGNLLK